MASCWHHKELQSLLLGLQHALMSCKPSRSRRSCRTIAAARSIQALESSLDLGHIGSEGEDFGNICVTVLGTSDDVRE